MLDFFKAGGFGMFVIAAVGIALLITAVQFARNADAQRLSLIRALTRALVFATVVAFTAGLASTAKYVAGERPDEPLVVLLVGFAESTANLILGGGVGFLAWILVAVGVRRMPADRS